MDKFGGYDDPPSQQLYRHDLFSVSGVGLCSARDLAWHWGINSVWLEIVPLRKQKGILHSVFGDGDVHEGRGPLMYTYEVLPKDPLFYPLLIRWPSFKAKKKRKMREAKSSRVATKGDNEGEEIMRSVTSHLPILIPHYMTIQWSRTSMPSDEYSEVHILVPKLKFHPLSPLTPTCSIADCDGRIIRTSRGIV